MCHPVIWIKRKFDDDDDAYMTDHGLNHDYNRLMIRTLPDDGQRQCKRTTAAELT